MTKSVKAARADTRDVTINAQIQRNSPRGKSISFLGGMFQPIENYRPTRREKYSPDGYVSSLRSIFYKRPIPHYHSTQKWFSLHVPVHQCKQAVLLPQTDRAKRCISQNLVNCRNKLYNKSTFDKCWLTQQSDVGRHMIWYMYNLQYRTA